MRTLDTMLMKMADYKAKVSGTYWGTPFSGVATKSRAITTFPYREQIHIQLEEPIVIFSGAIRDSILITADEIENGRHTIEEKEIMSKKEKETVEQIKETTYYRVIGKEKPKQRRTAPYFTQHLCEAKVYSELVDGEILKVKISPENPLFTNSLPDAAEKLGLFNRDFEVLLNGDGIEADNLVNDKAREKGFDVIVRRNGDWVIPLKSSIVSLISEQLVKGEHQNLNFNRR